MNPMTKAALKGLAWGMLFNAIACPLLYYVILPPIILPWLQGQ